MNTKMPTARNVFSLASRKGGEGRGEEDHFPVFPATFIMIADIGPESRTSSNAGIVTPSRLAMNSAIENAQLVRIRASVFSLSSPKGGEGRSEERRVGKE